MNRVALVGAGCGKGTLTLRGAELLKACDCVVYDSLLDGDVLSLVREGCERIFVGKRAGVHALPQKEINAVLLACARRYPLTVRLKGGDPFVFGRGGEELFALTAAGVACECVPGVTSAVAAAEFAGIPVTHRGIARGFHVVTAHTAEGRADVSRLAREEDTLVFLMAKASAREIAEELIEGGMSAEMPAALISNAGMDGMQSVRCTLARAGECAHTMPAPLVMVVGAVCAPEALRPPCGAAVAVTGTPSHTRRVCAALRAQGLTPIDCAFLRIVPRDFDEFFSRLSGVSLLVFTSPNGVRVFFARARELAVDHRAFAGKLFAVIGGETAAALREEGFCADLMPEEYTSAALARTIASRGIPASEVALLRSASGSGDLLAVGTQVDLYDAEAEEDMLDRALRAVSRAKYVTFGSAGGARALLNRAPLPKGCVPVCIGEETAKELRARGYVPVVAEQAGAQAIAAAIQREESCNG